MTLPAATPSVVIGSMSGVSNGQEFLPGALVGTALLVPQNCTGSNFQATVLGAQGTSTARVAVGFSSLANIAKTGFDVGSLSCTITADSGAQVSCSAPGSWSFAASDALVLGLFNFSNVSDYDNAKVMASFVCQ
jgi:hypothetical protein